MNAHCTVCNNDNFYEELRLSYDNMKDCYNFTPLVFFFLFGINLFLTVKENKNYTLHARDQKGWYDFTWKLKHTYDKNGPSE